jgi:hypothetical protein
MPAGMLGGPAFFNPLPRITVQWGATARLGGHQNRKCDGHPGWLVLWRGWMKLQAMLDGYLAARRNICGKTERPVK